MIFNLRSKEVLGVIESDSTKLMDSYDSTLKINKIGGVCVQGENPSPTNPQEIKNSVVSEIKTHANNCLNMRNAKGGVSNGITVTMNANGSYSYVGTASNTDINVWLLGNYAWDTEIFTLPAGTYYVKGVNLYNNTKHLLWGREGTFITLKEDTVITGVRAVNAVSGTTYNETHYPIIVRTDKIPTTWESYTETSITLSNPINLYGIGDAQDVIEDGKIKRKYKEVIFNGKEIWTPYTSNNNIWFFNSSITDCANTSEIQTGNLMCDCLTVGSSNDVASGRVKNGIALVKATYGDRLIMSIDGITTLEDFKTWLSTHNVTIVYESSESVIEELPLTDQLALNCLKTFHGVTYVEFDGDVQATLNSDYATNLEGALTLQAYADNKIGKANTLVNRAEDETQSFEVRVERGLVYLYKDDVLHGIVGANNVNTNGKKYNTLNLRADTEADFIALTSKKDNSVSYFMNINKVPFTANNYTEPHYFDGDMRLVGDLKATGGVWSEETHIKKMGVNGGVAQAVEWVWDSTLGRWVLCTVTE